MKTVDYDEWQDVLCYSNGVGAHKTTSPKALVFGAGPGTTATRSFSVAVNLLGFDTVHYGYWLDSSGNHRLGYHETLEKFHLEELRDGSRHIETWNRINEDMEFALLLNPTSAVFDSPMAMYTTDSLHAFPNAKVIITHRDPYEWTKKRIQSYSNASPHLLHPCKLFLTNFTDYQVAEGFVATERAVSCLVGKQRYLQVHAWNPPSESEGIGYPAWPNF